MTGDRWHDDFRYSDTRGDFHFEDTVTRSRRTADIASVLKICSPGELQYLAQIFELWTPVTHKGINGIGHALLVLIDAEVARRELEQAATLAQFDCIAAANRPDPLPTGPTADLPRWSEISTIE